MLRKARKGVVKRPNNMILRSKGFDLTRIKDVFNILSGDSSIWWYLFCGSCNDKEIIKARETLIIVIIIPIDICGGIVEVTA